MRGTANHILLLLTTFLYFTSRGICHDSSRKTTDNVLCRQCGADISNSNHLFNYFSPAALGRGNQTLFGKPEVQLQLLENPLGIRFHVVTVTKADCIAGDTWRSEFSWFPGYTWRHCICPRCKHHLGWAFKHSFERDEGFYAIVLDNVLSEQFSDSLMVIPKVCRS